MPALVIASPQPLSGKTTVAAALGRRIHEAGRRVALVRLAGDEHAQADAALYAGLAFNERPDAEAVDPGAAVTGADLTLVEAPAGDAAGVARAMSARAVVVAAYADPLPDELGSLCRALGDACAGVLLTRVPSRRLEAGRAGAEALGVPLLALIVEDRLLAAPTLSAVARALDAEAALADGAGDRVVRRPIISSISADPAQGYFARYDPDVVIVRGDKPDQQLGALNAGARCLIVTGGLPVLSYVTERAEEDAVPILRTPLDTVTAVARMEALYAATPFRGDAKVERAAQLVSAVDLAALD